MRRTPTIKVAVIRKFIKGLPKTAENKEPIRVLKKQLVNYEKYAGIAELAVARGNLAESILVTVQLLNRHQ